MSDNFFKIKNGLNLPTLSSNPVTGTPPSNPVVGDMAFFGGKLYIYDGSAWGIKPGSSATGLITDVDVSSVVGDRISGNKITPDFGSQNVSTSGNISTTGNLTANGASSKLYVDVSSGAAAVEIRQLGSGNALTVVDDNSGIGGTDPSVTIIDANGNVGIGVAANATLTNKLEVLGNVLITGAAKIVSGNLTFDTAQGIESHTAASSLNIGSGTNTSTINIGAGTGTQTLNIGTGSNTQTVNIGTGAGTTTINIGGAGDNVVVAGTLTTVNTTNLDVADKNITLNKGGAAGSANGSGINIEANSVVQASLTYDQTDGSAQPQDAFTFSGVGAVKLSAGTTAQRPNTPSQGMVRYNSSTSSFEGYDGSAWAGLGGAAKQSSNSTLTAGGSITINTSPAQDWLICANASGLTTLSTTPFGGSAPTFAGTVITLIGSDSDKLVVIDPSPSVAKGLIMNGSVTIGKGSVIQFKYNSTLDRWLEVCRNELLGV